MSTDGADAAIRRRYVFHGRVQGVFFRATSAELARGRAVTGFVRNLPDGTVELEAQGAASEIDALVSDIQRRYEGNITHIEQTEISPREGEAAFEVRY
ncbi:MAG: acylphosphatase [Planctomycetota bacterium]|nr:MAG: acylphosphatase [Planctomycetota bacterium]